MATPLYGIGSDPVLLLRARRLAEQRRREEEERLAAEAENARGEEAMRSALGGAAMSPAARSGFAYRSPYDINLDPNFERGGGFISPDDPASHQASLGAEPPSGATKVSETRTIPPEVARRRLSAPEASDDLSLAANQRTAELMDAEERGFYRAQEQAEAPRSSVLRFRVGNEPWRERTYDTPTGKFAESVLPDLPARVRGAVSVMGRDPGELPPSDYDLEQAERSARVVNARRIAAQAQREIADPNGIQAHVARKMAELQASRLDPQEQRRAAADAQRRETVTAFLELQDALAAGPYTEAQKQESIRKFLIEQAQQSGDFRALTQLLGVEG